MAKQNLRDRAKYFCCGLSVVALIGLTACQNAILTPTLTADATYQIDTVPELIGANGTYIRQFRYEDVSAIALSYVGVSAGEVIPIWEGQHAAATIDRDGSAILMLSEGSLENPDALQVSFSFANAPTTSSGEGRLLSEEDLGLTDAIASQNESFVTWDIPNGANIPTGEPTLVHWKATVPTVEDSYDLSLSTLDDMLQLSREQPELVFQAVTIQILD